MCELNGDWINKASWPELPSTYKDPLFEDKIFKRSNYHCATFWKCLNCETLNMYFRHDCRQCGQAGIVICRWKDCNQTMSRDSIVQHIYQEHIFHEYNDCSERYSFKCYWGKCYFNGERLNHLDSHLAIHIHVPMLICRNCPPHFFLRENDHRNTSRENKTEHNSNDACLIRPRTIKHRSMSYNRNSRNFQVLLRASISAKKIPEKPTTSFVPLVELPPIESFDRPPVIFSMLPPISTFFDLTSEPFERKPTSIVPRRACAAHIPSSPSYLFHPGQEQSINDLFKRSFQSIYDTY